MTPATDETPKPPRWRRWAIEIGIFVAVFFAIQAWMARDVPAGPAPDFATVAADGRALSLAEWRSAHLGQAVGVYFWAEWCPICTAQQGTIEGVQAFVIVDPAGQIRSVSLGYTTGWGLRARLWWAGVDI